MATVSVATPSSTHTTPVATPMSRRLPLNSVPQAVNSPLRARTTPSTLAGKRQRQDAAVENATIDDEQPPSKKQHLNNTTGAPVPTPQTPVGQKIIVREKKGSVNRKVTKQKVAAEARPRGNGNDNETGRQEEEKNNMDEVKAWQRHYKRAFPTYVFFFENIPDEQGLRLIKQVKILGSVCCFWTFLGSWVMDTDLGCSELRGSFQARSLMSSPIGQFLRISESLDIAQRRPRLPLH